MPTLRYPSIPEPTTDPASLRDAVLSIKQMLEILTGQRGNTDNAAVMPGDLAEAIDGVNAAKVNRAGDTMTGPLALGGSPSQYSATISVRGDDAANGVEWGHPNPLGYGNTLGYDFSSGNGWLLFNGSAGTNINTYKTYGKAGSLVKSDLAGGLIFGAIPNVSADNQTATQTASLDNVGNLRTTTSVKAGDAGGSTDMLSVVKQSAANVMLGLYQGGVGQWSVGMISGSGLYRFRSNGPAGTDILTIDSATAEIAWTGAPWTAYTPTVTIPSGAGTVNAARFKRLGKTVALYLDIAVTTGGTQMLISLPSGVAIVTNSYLVGREVNLSGLTWVGQVGGTGVLLVRANDAATAVTAGHRYQLNGVFETT